MPRLALERHLGKGVAPLLQGLDGLAVDPLGELLVDLVVGPLLRGPRVVEGRAVAYAARVSQQLPQGDGLLQRLVLLLPPLRQYRHVAGRERGNVLRDRIVQVDVVGGHLDKGHEGGGHEALRHGEEAEYGVSGHPDLGLRVGVPCLLVVDHLSVPHDAAGDPRKVLHPRPPAQVLAHPLERRLVHAHGLRLAAGPPPERLALGGHGVCRQADRLAPAQRQAVGRGDLLQELAGRRRLRSAYHDQAVEGQGAEDGPERLRVVKLLQVRRRKAAELLRSGKAQGVRCALDGDVDLRLHKVLQGGPRNLHARCVPHWTGGIPRDGGTLRHVVTAATQSSAGRPVACPATGWQCT
mmetsp:Transcript_70754/g.223518  ORF Transcript_70754/g.223518 Transcript_70754/m.223518 type:complete len:352 (-) Transcript_70754:7-1062(-)